MTNLSVELFTLLICIVATYAIISQLYPENRASHVNGYSSMNSENTSNSQSQTGNDSITVPSANPGGNLTVQNDTAGIEFMGNSAKSEPCYINSNLKVHICYPSDWLMTKEIHSGNTSSLNWTLDLSFVPCRETFPRNVQGFSCDHLNDTSRLLTANQVFSFPYPNFFLPDEIGPSGFTLVNFNVSELRQPLQNHSIERTVDSRRAQLSGVAQIIQVTEVPVWKKAIDAQQLSYTMFPLGSGVPIDSFNSATHVTQIFAADDMRQYTISYQLPLMSQLSPIMSQITGIVENATLGPHAAS